MSYCPKCGKEVVADAKFCASCGAILQTTVQAAPTPTSAYTSSSPLGDLGSRIVAGIVDYVIIGIVTCILALLLFLPVLVMTGIRMMSGGGPGGFRGFLGILVVMWLLWLIYFTYFEGTSGQTIGKKLAHIKVIKEDGSKCNIGSALVRNILRIVDHLPFLYLLGIILIAATNKKQRLGDMLGKTIVVKA